MARYFVNKLSFTVDIKNVYIEKKYNNFSKKQRVIKSIFGERCLEVLIQLKKVLKEKKSKVLELDKKIEKEKLYQYFKDFNEIVAMNKFDFYNINLTSTRDINTLKSDNIDILILFGTSIIKENILSLPKIGTINFHSSILPYYKGSRVEFWQLYYDDYDYCGSTVHYVDTSVDTGDIIIQEKIEVDKKDIFWDLRYKNIIKGLELIPKAIELIQKNEPTKKQANIRQQVFKGSMITEDKIKELYVKKGFII